MSSWATLLAPGSSISCTNRTSCGNMLEKSKMLWNQLSPLNYYLPGHCLICSHKVSDLFKPLSGNTIQLFFFFFSPSLLLLYNCAIDIQKYMWTTGFSLVVPHPLHSLDQMWKAVCWLFLFLCKALRVISIAEGWLRNSAVSVRSWKRWSF